MGNSNNYNVDIHMPTPPEFAQRLRTDLQAEYLEFIKHKYKFIPSFINYNEKLVFERLCGQYRQLWLSRYDIHGSLNLLAMLNPYPDEEAQRKPFIGRNSWLYYVPNIFNTAPDELKQEVLENIQDCYRKGFTCWFTDWAVVAALITAESKNAKPPEHLTTTSEPQLVDFTWHDFISLNKNTELGHPVKKVLMVSLEKEQGYTDQNDYSFDIFAGRQIIHVSWSNLRGAHATTVIVDNELRKFFVLDSNGVDECAAAVYQYFSRRFKFPYEKYELMRVMKYSAGQTPKSFQYISNNSFCQTWNLFSQLLVINNRCDEDVDDFIFNKIIAYARPIIDIQPDRELSEDVRARINLTLIILEFMFYISKTFPEFIEFYTKYSDYNYAAHVYRSSSQYDDDLYVMLQPVAERNNTTVEKIIESDFSGDREFMDFVHDMLMDKFKDSWNRIGIVSSYNVHSDVQKHIDKTVDEITGADISAFLWESIKNGKL